METEVKKIPYLDLKAINEPYEKELKNAINKVVNSGWYLQGEAVKRFEKSYAQFIGTEYCISCANGTDALKLMPVSYTHSPSPRDSTSSRMPSSA